MASRLVLPGLLGAVLDMTCSKQAKGGADGECIEQGHNMPRQLIQSCLHSLGRRYYAKHGCLEQDNYMLRRDVGMGGDGCVGGCMHGPRHWAGSQPAGQPEHAKPVGGPGHGSPAGNQSDPGHDLLKTVHGGWGEQMGIALSRTTTCSGGSPRGRLHLLGRRYYAKQMPVSQFGVLSRTATCSGGLSGVSDVHPLKRRYYPKHNDMGRGKCIRGAQRAPFKILQLRPGRRYPVFF